MSSQIKSITAIPITENSVIVDIDDTDYVAAESVDKVLTRTADHYAVDDSTIHASVKDSPGVLISVVSQDPLIVRTTGFDSTSYSGCDGLVTNGISIARGIVKENYTTNIALEEPSFVSIMDHYYLLGGKSDSAYMRTVWHSTDGKSYEALSATPPWDGRYQHLTFSNGTDIWVLGGNDGVSDLQDIWHGTIAPTTGIITWNVAALGTGLTILDGRIKGALHDELSRIYVGGGYIDLTDGTEIVEDRGTEADEDLMFYDSARHILSYSDAGLREEWILDDDGTELGNEDIYVAYTHIQSAASTSWTILHNLGDAACVPVFFDADDELIEPASITEDSVNQFSATFNTAVSGKCIVRKGTAYSGSMWSIPDKTLTSIGWFTVDSEFEVLEPVDAVQSGLDTTLNFNSVVSGRAIVIEPYALNEVRGRRYLASGIFPDTSETIETYQTDANSLWWLRGTGNSELIIPASIDISTKDTTFTFSATPGVIYTSMENERTGNSKDLDDPWSSATDASIGSNAKNDQLVYVLTNDSVYYSPDGTVQWETQTGTGLAYKAYPMPVVVEDNAVATINEDDVYHSLDAGDTFTLYSNETGSQDFVFYGPLFDEDIDIFYRFYLYQRPSDVVWQSSYGDGMLASGIMDDYSTHYRLPYPAVLSGNDSVVSFTLDSDYGDSILADEWKSHFLYITDAGTGEVLEKKEISSNSATAAGSSVTVWMKTPLTSTIDSTIRAQVISRREEKAIYYSLLTRNYNYHYWAYHESDGTSFLKSQEQTYEYFAHLISKGGLPEFVATDSNKNLINLFHTEMNRSRVESKQFYNDPYTLPPELLERLGEELGVGDVTDLNLRKQRNLIANYHSQINQYGPCKLAIEKLIDLVLGVNSGVTVSLSMPADNTIAGQVLNISLSNYSDYSWTWDSTDNPISHNGTNFTMDATLSNIAATRRTMTHRSMVHLHHRTLDLPYLILDHTFAGVTVTLDLDRKPTGFIDGESVIATYTDIQMKTIYTLVALIERFIPFYVGIIYS
jgi:hypothetical protein